MSLPPYQALVVDDDPAIRKLTVMALARDGFQCRQAADGVQAAEQIGKARFDVVITDLAMPVRSGHSLCVELLALREPPVIVVLTGVADPRLARDLFSRGVDDVIIKPVRFPILAAKIRMLVDRRRRETNCEVNPPRTTRVSAAPAPIGISTLIQRLAGMGQILPLSCMALDVYALTTTSEASNARIAAALARDASLVAEVLRLANDSIHFHGSRRIAELEEAVQHIGRKRIGEVALATHALGSLTTVYVPWMNTSLMWRRSIAAGVALELLVEQGSHGPIAEGLLAAAIVHSLGRLVLGSLYSAEYEYLIAVCRASGSALSTAESLVFPMSHTAVLALVLKTWNIPADIHAPLSAFGEPYQVCAALAEPMRSKAELLKIAVLTGDLAVGRWEPWDLLELPPPSVLERLRLDDLGEAVQRTAADLEAIIHFETTPSPRQWTGPNTAEAQPARGQIACRNLCEISGPSIAPILKSLGLCLAEPSADVPLLVNAVGCAPDSIARGIAELAEAPAIVLIDEAVAATSDRPQNALSFPSSYAQLQAALGTLPASISNRPISICPTDASHSEMPSAGQVEV